MAAENYFRYARIHFDLDAHDSYTTHDDDPERSVPDPARATAYQHLLTARGEDACCPRPGRRRRRRRAAGAEHPTARGHELHDQQRRHHPGHRRPRPRRRPAGRRRDRPRRDPRPAAPRTGPPRPAGPGHRDQADHPHHPDGRVQHDHRAGPRHPDQHQLPRATDEAHTLARQALATSGDIQPGHNTLTITLDPLPTRRATTAIAELCNHLNATATRYPGTDLTLHFAVKNQP